MIRSFFLGFIKIHILHHATKKPVYGLWFIEELKRHGYDISPGTLYPILHSLEEDGLLQSQEQVVDGKVRKYYRITSKGKKTLQQGKEQVQELLNEIIEDQ
jgi:DNA-binding PadR family transcriptional regulator